MDLRSVIVVIIIVEWRIQLLLVDVTAAGIKNFHFLSEDNVGYNDSNDEEACDAISEYSK